MFAAHSFVISPPSCCNGWPARQTATAQPAATYHYSTTPQYQFDHPMDNSENKLSPFYSDKLYSTSLHTSISQLSASILQLLSIKLISYPITLYSQQQDSISHRSPSLCPLPYLISQLRDQQSIDCQQNIKTVRSIPFKIHIQQMIENTQMAPPGQNLAVQG